jgi:DNA-directed RNA polymerase specialized sigma24 family protein
MTDGELLSLYVEKRSREAFGQLVARHAPMVYATCLRVTGSRRLAEAAAQAAFLVLVQSAARVAGKRTLCGWLHGVAYRSALRARAQLAGRAKGPAPDLNNNLAAAGIPAGSRDAP